MSLRAANQSDIRAIAEVHVGSWRSTYVGQVPQSYLDELSVPKREIAWKEALANSEHQIIVSEENEKLQGFVSFGPSRDPDSDTAVGEIYAIYLLEEYKGQGVGQSLWSEAIRSLKLNSYSEVTVWVLDTNSVARKFYERNGLVADGATKSATIGGKEVMELRYRMRFK